MRTTAQILNRNGAGFTLIELVVAFSVMAILATVGMASFLSFSRAQTLQQATNDLMTTLNTAKAKAVTQTKPADCLLPQEKTLNGYQVILVTVNSYKLRAICNGSPVDISATPTSLPTGVQFASSVIIPTTITFSVMTGGVTITPPSTDPLSIQIKGVSGLKTITIDSGGNIAIPTP
jgi:prepilin-type N-terminal cleavage/methylation domain-containing protein